MEILALDVGAKRIGIARASMEARLAQPLMTVKTEAAIEQLQELIKKTGVKMIVVGLPRNLSGEDTNQTRWVRNWITQAKTDLDAVFYWQDEALTSLKAESLKLEAKDMGVDAEAAAIILDDFLTTDKNNWVLV